ncbi:hypothetical protein GCM10027271_16690 [Saccharopolyspora gloriosae]
MPPGHRTVGAYGGSAPVQAKRSPEDATASTGLLRVETAGPDSNPEPLVNNQAGNPPHRQKPPKPTTAP